MIIHSFVLHPVWKIRPIFIFKTILKAGENERKEEKEAAERWPGSHLKSRCLHLKETLETHVAPAPSCPHPFTNEDMWAEEDLTMILSSSQITLTCKFQWIHSIDFWGCSQNTKRLNQNEELLTNTTNHHQLYLCLMVETPSSTLACLWDKESKPETTAKRLPYLGSPQQEELRQRSSTKGKTVRIHLLTVSVRTKPWPASSLG